MFTSTDDKQFHTIYCTLENNLVLKLKRSLFNYRIIATRHLNALMNRSSYFPVNRSWPLAPEWALGCLHTNHVGSEVILSL